MEVVHDGSAELAGEFLGLRIRASMDGSFTGYAEQLRLVTWNYTSRPVLQQAVNPQSGGQDRNHTHAQLSSGRAMNEVDFLIVPKQGGPTPHASANASRVHLTSAQGSLDEVAYVDGRRPTLHQPLEEALSITMASGKIRIEGDFEVSIWGWDFRAADDDVKTGSHRDNMVRDPVTGREIVADVVEQVARLTIHEGWIDLVDVAQADLYAGQLSMNLTGTTTLHGLSGTLHAKGSPHLSEATLVLLGSSRIEAARAPTGGFVDILHSEGATLDGRTVRLFDHPAGPRPGTTVDLRVGRERNGVLPASAGIAAIMVVLAVAHGPMQGFRFTRLQRSFEDRDYLKVLARIDPFTRRRRFQRRATLLKAVSLLSVEAFREAALYLETVDARTGPDPATTAFLRACAMAGQGHDALAIEHLTACFRIDPSYRDEARNVPALADLLPYLELAKA